MIFRIIVLVLVANWASVHIGMWAGWLIFFGYPAYKLFVLIKKRVKRAQNTVLVGTVLWKSSDDLHDEGSKDLYDQHFM